DQTDPGEVEKWPPDPQRPGTIASDHDGDRHQTEQVAKESYLGGAVASMTEPLDRSVGSRQQEHSGHDGHDSASDVGIGFRCCHSARASWCGLPTLMPDPSQLITSFTKLSDNGTMAAPASGASADERPACGRTQGLSFAWQTRCR